MKQIVKYPLIALFALFLLVFSAVDMVVNRREFSENENRYLEQQPAFTWKTLMNKKYAQKYEKYINDQFVFRDQWIGLKSRTEILIGKQENNGIVYGRDHYMFSRYDSVSKDKLAANLDYVAQFFAKYPEIPATFSIIPNSYMVLSDRLPFGLEQVDQYAMIDKLYQGIPAPAETLSLRETLTEHKDQYIYYMTDHHWTTHGAYLAYSEFVRAKGMEPVSLDTLKANDVPGFLGTYFSKSLRYNAVADTIRWYDIPVADITIDGGRTVLDASKKEVPVQGMYHLEQFEKRDKYGAFLYGNNGITVIQSAQNLSHVEGETSRILLIKDSYGNSLVPFLACNYDEVVVVDLRSVEKISQVLEDYEFDDIWFLYNFDNFEYDTNLVRLKY